MAIPRLHKETSIFDESKTIYGGIDDAANRVAALEEKTILRTTTSTSTKSFSANTVVNAYSLTLPAGLWVVRGWLTIYPSSAGQVQLTISDSSTTWTNADRTEYTDIKSGIYHNMTFLNLDSQKTIYLNVRCSVSGTYSYGGLEALKVK